MRNYESSCCLSPRDRLTMNIVRGVQRNDEHAILDLLDIFEAKIKAAATEVLYDRWGNPVRIINPDYESYIEDRLIHAFRKIGKAVCDGRKDKGGKCKCKKSKKKR